jgi:geranyl-CoA carboxylase alpha subunit
MKMQHVHAAPMSGRVAAIHVRAGEQVGAARVLIEIAAGEA